MNRKKTVLCVTHSADSFPVDWVIEHLLDQGVNGIRIDSDAYPYAFKMSGVLNHEPKLIIETSTQTISSDQISAIWHRKNRHCNLKPHVDEAMLKQAIRESEMIKTGLLHSLYDVFWLDHPEKQARAENKWHQLSTAKRVGLNVPASLFTNDPKQALSFYQAQRGQVVVKMHTPFVESMGKPSAFVYTSKLTEAHLPHLEELKFSPMIFQAQIEKEAEIRLAYVDGQCFAATIEMSEESKDELDWRKAKPTSQWLQVALPQELQQKLAEFMALMGLKFGAIDLILDKRGQYQFLEVNPAGEWGMLEQQTGMPISQHIAQCLLENVC